MPGWGRGCGAIVRAAGVCRGGDASSLDERFAEWGEGPYYTVTLLGTVTLPDMLAHLYVLSRVLDDQKHYWIGDDEVEKLLRHGGRGWRGTPRRN